MKEFIKENGILILSICAIAHIVAKLIKELADQ